jgi:4-hydroxy-3-methylbut-2-enyl diphosphate reductase
MKIIIADKTGFCFGVKRAYEACEKCFGGNFCTLGEIVHNKEIQEEVRERGGRIVENLNEIAGDKVIIRAHGISDKKHRELRKKTKNIHDASCPFVKNLQFSAKNFAKKGFTVVIIGKASHPEIQAITEDLPEAKVIFSEKEASNFQKCEKIGLISQTTERIEKVQKIKNILKTKCNFLEHKNTICSDVKDRQRSAEKLAKSCDLVLVIGGKNSSNTEKLLEICKKFTKSYKIETENDIDKKWLCGIKKLGLITGASTPERTLNNIRDFLAK